MCTLHTAQEIHIVALVTHNHVDEFCQNDPILSFPIMFYLLCTQLLSATDLIQPPTLEQFADV